MKWLVCCLLFLSACKSDIRTEADIRRALATGTVILPVGVVEIHAELAAPEGMQGLEVRGQGPQSILRAAPDFRGRAIFTVKSGTRIRFRDFTIEGARDALEQRVGLPPYDQSFARFYANNGILLENVSDAAVTGVHFQQIAGFPILVNASKTIRIERVVIEQSGSRNAAGRNNTTGGILLEEGTSDFEVTDSEFTNIRGSGVWTHSLYTSPRNAGGLIAGNRFASIGRDAIQVGHATHIRVERNSGERIGYPESDVDVENKAVPVAIDTAGNTDLSVYSGNRFSDINGKCIDLDGFHQGQVIGNTCTNLKNFGIVMNDTNPDMKPDAVTISDNTIDGAGYGGIFVIGSNNRVLRNKLLNLNTAKCESCFYVKTEPDMLRSGIYLGRGAERPAVARGNVIEDNEISGFRMKTHCVGMAPGVSAEANQVDRNRCADVY
jgi:hypothetical protein